MARARFLPLFAVRKCVRKLAQIYALVPRIGVFLVVEELALGGVFAGAVCVA